MTIWGRRVSAACGKFGRKLLAFRQNESRILCRDVGELGKIMMQACHHAVAVRYDRKNTTFGIDVIRPDEAMRRLL
jgi:hypothetical protein